MMKKNKKTKNLDYFKFKEYIAERKLLKVIILRKKIIFKNKNLQKRHHYLSMRFKISNLKKFKKINYHKSLQILLKKIKKMFTQ